MFELLTGTGLAVAAGLNAYIPMILIGLASRFLDFFELPEGWRWLENPVVLIILGVLLVIEIVADKIPIVDSVNDWIQTIIRPAAGGIVFGAGSGATTALVEDPVAFFQSNQWVPIVSGIIIALFVHGGKMIARPAINAATLGVGAPVVSTAEDISSVVMSIFAIVLPILVLLGIAGLIVAFIALYRRASKRRREREAASTP